MWRKRISLNPLKHLISSVFPVSIQKLLMTFADAIASLDDTWGISSSSSSEDASESGILDVHGSAATSGAAVGSSVSTSSSTVK